MCAEQYHMSFQVALRINQGVLFCKDTSSCMLCSHLNIFSWSPTVALILVQGAATSMYAATSPQLVGKSGAYLQDCKVAQPNAQAQDAELAKKLWTITEQQIDEALARVQ